MANVPKAITDLPVASAMGDDDLLVVSQNATTSSIKGELIKGYAQNAVASQVTAAQTAANQAGQSATQAEAARQGAAAAQTAAESAQDAAETARDQSVAAAGTIGDSVEQAQTAAGQASSARDAAVAAQTAAETAKTAAETASGQAQTAATQAAGSATAAQTAATQAGDAKTDAETARNEAETSASSAANSASDAESAATEAEQAKTYIENMDMEGETLPAGSSVTVTKTTSPEGNLLFVIGVPQGTQGDKGETGETGATGPQGVSITNATVNEDGDLVITLSSGSPINAGSVIGPQGIQGEVGPTGASVDRIERTSGTGAPGTTDTYTVYLTDGKTGGTFQVYNGSNGAGAGDFMADGSVPMTGDLQMGGHKITNLAEPTDNTDAASKEYVDDTITVSLVGNYIPTGQKGQANGVASLDGSGKVPSAQLPPMDYVPTSRTVNGHALSADVALDADDVGAIPNPTSGTAGQVLTKTADGSAWENAPSGLPDGGTEGQMLYKSADGAAWGDKPVMVVNVTKGGDGTYTADKTYTEIMDTINTEVIVIAKESVSDTSAYSFYALMGYNDEVIAFGYSNNTEGYQYIIKSDDSVQVVEYSYGLTTHGGTMVEYSEIETVPDDSGNKTTLSFYENRISISTNSGDTAGIDVTGSTFKGKNSSFVGVRGKYVTIGGEWWYGDYAHSEAIRIEEVTPGDVDTGQKPVYSTKIHFLADPTDPQDATNKQYVDTQLSTKLTTPTGTAGQLLGFTADNTVGAVDAPESGLTQEQADERYLQLSGGTMTGAIMASFGQDFGIHFDGTSNSIAIGSGGPAFSISATNNVEVYSDPTTANGVANKSYVDSKSPTSVTITLTTSGWSSNTQTVTVSGVSATETAQLITPTPAIASQSAYYEAGIMCTGQAANSLTFTCQTVPTSNLTVYVVIQPLS